MRIFVTVVLLVASTVTTALALVLLPFDDTRGAPSALAAATAVLWVLFALSLLSLRRVSTRASIVLVIAGSLAIGGAALAGPPNTSTDSARYAWDGIVQNAGISPYRYVPSDPALAALRTDWLFPPAVVGDDGGLECRGERIMTVKEPGTGDVLCTAINRATVPTIYPPTSEIAFAGVRLFSGADAQYLPSQVFGLLVSLGITGLLLHALVRSGRDPRWAAMWGWSPLAATEAVTNSHIDVLGALLLLVASLLVASGRRWTGGAALGAAIATKLIPVIGAPALLGRRPLRVIVASTAAFLLLYVPYVIADGVGVLGYLPGYLTEEGYSSGKRFVMLSLVLPGASSLVVAALLIVLTGVLVWWKTDPANPWVGQVVMIGTVLLVVSPRYSWYALLLVPMIAMSGRWEWLAVPLALTVRLLVPSVEWSRVSIALAVILIVGMALHRAGHEGRDRLNTGFRRAVNPFRPRHLPETPR